MSDTCDRCCDCSSAEDCTGKCGDCKRSALKRYTATVKPGSTIDFAGEWELVKETKAIFQMRLIKKPYFPWGPVVGMATGDSIRISRNGRTHMTAIEHGDGSFTTYPYRAGRPMTFTPVD